jgi:single-strand DNA-binding protein
MANFSFNKVIIGGRLTAEPELKTTQSGLSVVSFSVAVNRKVKQGEEQKADFFSVTAWKQTAEHISRWFHRGSSICIVGQLQNSSWEKDGQKHYKTEIIADEVFFVDSKNDAQGAETAQGGSFIPPAYQMPAQPKFEELANDDSLPF